MIRRILGLIMLLFGITGIGVSYYGAKYSTGVIEATASGVDSSLQLLIDSLDTVEETLTLARSTVVDVNSGMETVVDTANHLSESIDETQPLLGEIGTIASQEVPDSLESIEEALPSVVQVAGVVDDTLTTLNSFKIDQRILGIQIKYDLGIDYDPPVPFDESLSQIGSSLEPLPDRLRLLQSHVDVTSSNLEMISSDITLLAEDLNRINGRVAEVGPQLEGYLKLVTDVGDRARRVRSSIQNQVDDARKMVTVLMVWLGLTQAAPLVLGWEMVKGRRLR